MTWPHRQFFWPCFASSVNFSFSSKFHGNIFTGSGVMTICFYTRLTWNPEIRNTPIGVLFNITRLGWTRKIKFSMNVSNKMLLNVSKFWGYSSCSFWVIKWKPTGSGQLNGCLYNEAVQLKMRSWFNFKASTTQTVNVVLWSLRWLKPSLRRVWSLNHAGLLIL